MAQEYVVVEDPHAERPAPSPGPSRGRRAQRLWVAVCAVLAIGLVAALVWPEGGSDDGEVEEAVPDDPDRLTNAARITAVVYQEWLSRSEHVACLAERGFPYEARIVNRADALETVAQFFELEPVTANPEAPLPLLRQPDLYLGRGGAAMAERTRGGSACTMPTRAVDLDDESAVENAVAAARADGPFLETVAEQVWVQQNPAEVTHQVALLGYGLGEGSGGDADIVWPDALAVVAEVAQERTVWVPVVSADEAGFAQSVGLTATGGAVVVRVGDEYSALNRRTHMTRADTLACGPVTISAGVKGPWGETSDLDNLIEALGPACNALIGQGIVEGESLADVYWD